MSTVKNNFRKKKQTSKSSLKTKPKTPLFIHIPKTAGSSIEEILYLNNYKESRPQKILKKYQHSDILKTEYRFLKHLSKHHLPLSVYKPILEHRIKNNYHLFAVVRNPYERIISDFRFWVSQFYPQHQDSSNYQFKKLCMEIKRIIPNLKINSENLNSFVHYVLGDDHYKFSVLDGHLIPMHQYTHKAIKVSKNPNKWKYISFCRVLKFENLDQDFNKLIKELYLRIPLNSTKNTVHNKSKGMKLTPQELDLESRQLIKRRYSVDFKLFKYSYLKE